MLFIQGARVVTRTLWQVIGNRLSVISNQSSVISNDASLRRVSHFARLRYASPGFTSRACRAKLVERSLISPISYFRFPISSFLLCFFLLQFSTPSILSAATRDWTGAAACCCNRWGNPCNWDSSVPDSCCERARFTCCPVLLVDQCIQMCCTTFSICKFQINSAIDYTINCGTMVLSGNSPSIESKLTFNNVTVDMSCAGNRISIGSPASAGCLVWNGGSFIAPGGQDLDVVNGSLCATCFNICIGEDLHLSECNDPAIVEFTGGCLVINDSITISNSAWASECRASSDGLPELPP